MPESIFDSNKIADGIGRLSFDWIVGIRLQGRKLLIQLEALARSHKIREVGARVISGVRRCDYFGLWLSLVERLVRDNSRIIFSNNPDSL